jgi:hypothetical protein
MAIKNTDDLPDAFGRPDLRHRSNRSGGKPIPAVDRFASLSAFLQSHGIRSQPTLELPYLDWLKLHHLLEKEIDQELHVGGRIDALVTRGLWFHCCGVKIRSTG